MGGPESDLWIEFQHLLLKGLMAARKHMDRVINLVEIMRSSKYIGRMLKHCFSLVVCYVCFMSYYCMHFLMIFK